MSKKKSFVESYKKENFIILKRIKSFVKEYQGISAIILSGITILLSTFVNYLVFTYKSNYYKYFNVQIQDITVQDNHSFFLIIFGTIVFIMFFFEVAFLAFLIRMGKPKRVLNIVFTSLGYLILNSLIISYIFWDNIEFYNLLVSVIVSLIVLVFQFFYSVYWIKFLFNEKADNRKKIKCKRNNKNIKLRKSTGKVYKKPNNISSIKIYVVVIFVITLIVFLLLTISIGASGRRNAKNNKVFYLSESCEQVVIYDDGEKLILADCIWDKKKFILDMNTGKTIVISKMNFPLERIECDYVKVDGVIS